MKRNFKNKIIFFSILIGILSLNSCGADNKSSGGKQTEAMNQDDNTTPDYMPSSENVDYYNGLYFSFETLDQKEVAVVTGFDNNIENVVIPNAYKNFAVQIIDVNAFKDSSKIKSITLPEHIKIIRANAFDGCMTLEELIIPDSVTEIGKYAFKNCTSINNINIPANIESLEEGIFFGCTSLDNIDIPSNVKSIGNNAFNYCTNLKEINIPSKITYIGSNAFSNCIDLEKLIINKTYGTINIVSNAFSGCSNLKDITMPVDYIEFIPKSSLEKVNITNGYQIPDEAFKDCYILKEITLPETINQIGQYAFYNCASLEKIDIPKNVTNIRNYAFANCSSLTEITIPKNINTIGNHVFDNCSLNKLTIPAEALYKMVLDYIDTLIITSGDIYNNDCKFKFIGELIIEDEVTYISNYAFANTSVGKAKVPYKYLNSIPKDVEELTILDTEEIEDNAFIEFKNLKKINLPDNITKIGDNSFKGLDKLESINLPKSLNTIGESAFDGCISLEELIIPDSVKKIGKYAFKNCTSINNINIPANIESLEEGIFFGCTSLDNIDIPSNVKSIGNNAFDGCINLSTIYIPDTINNVGDDLFLDCDSLDELNFKITSIDNYLSMYNLFNYSYKKHFIDSNTMNELTEIEINTNLNNIPERAFYNSKSLTKITIGNNVKTINDEAFYGCNNVSIAIIGSGVTNIKTNAFKNCDKLYEVYNLSNLGIEIGKITNGYIAYSALVIHNTLSEDKIKYVSKDDFEFAYINNNLYLLNYVGEDAEIVLPSSVTIDNILINNYEINKKAFYKNDLITKIIIPSSVKRIHGYAFYKCTNLNNLTISLSNKTILDQYCEGSNDKLKNINLKIDNIDEFLNLDGIYEINGKIHLIDEATNEEITDVTISNGITNINEYAFKNCAYIKNITIPNTVTSIGKYAFWNCESLESIIIPEGVTSLEASTFKSCESLKNVTLPSTLTKIGESAFWNCKSLESIIIPEGVTSLEASTFKSCDSLKNVTLPSTLTEIGDSAFSYCYTLDNIIIPNNVKLIGSYAFDSCESLTSINIPSNVTIIPIYAFKNCKLLTNISMSDSVEVIDNNAFDGCESLYSLTLPSNITKIYDCTFKNCKSLTNIIIPDSVKSIGESAFSGAISLEYIYLPKDLETIELLAFNGCDKLKDTYIKSSMDKYLVISGLENIIGKKHFIDQDNQEIEEITIPSNINYISDEAFSNSTINSIIMHENINSIGKNSFFNTNIFNAKLPLLALNYLDCKKLLDVEILNGEIIKANLFKDSAIKNISIPSTIKEIGKDAFLNCINLNLNTYDNGYYLGNEDNPYLVLYKAKNEDITSINIHEDCKIIYNNALENTKIKNINISDNIIFIGKDAFLNSLIEEAHVTYYGLLNLYTSNLKTLYLLDGDEIGEDVLSNALLLEEIHIPSTIKEIKNDAFKNCNNIKDTYFDIESIDNYLSIIGLNEIKGLKHLINDKDEEITEINISSDVSEIADYAFSNLNGIIKINIPSTVLNVGTNSFINTKIEEINAPAFIMQYIEKDNLKNVVINSGEVLYKDSFKNAINLSSVTFNDDLNKIEDNAFEACKLLKKINIPSNVISVANTAFKDCEIEEAVVPSIALNAIPKNHLVKVNVISGDSISENAFKDAYVLNEVILPSTITSIGNNAFEYCESLENIIIPSTVLSIGNNAFKGCVLIKEIYLPDTITRIYDNTFANCTSLKKVKLPNKLNSISSNAFINCLIENAELPINALNVIDRTNLKTLIITSGGGSINSDLLSESTKLTKFTLLYDLTVDKNAFANCPIEYASVPASIISKLPKSTLKELFINSGSSVASKALENYSKLEIVRIASSITSIETGAFQTCNHITDTYIYVESISNYLLIDGLAAIKGIKHFIDNETKEEITNIVIPSEVTTIPNSAFSNSLITSAVIGNDVETIENYAFYNSSILRIVIGENVGSIGNNSFQSCYKLVEVINLSNLNITTKSINNGCVGQYALNVTNDINNSIIIENDNGYIFTYYDNNAYLIGYEGIETNLVLPESFEYNNIIINNYNIYQSAFKNNKLIESIKILNNVQEIGESAFAYCKSLISIDLGSNIKRIGKETFYHSSSLENIIIGNNIMYVGEYAFYGCNLNYTEYQNGKYLGNDDNPYLVLCSAIDKEVTSFDINDDTRVIASYGFYSNKSLTSIIIPDNVVAINDDVFKNCTSLNSLVLDDNLIEIGAGAFNGCSQLYLELSLPNIKNIGASAFRNTAITSVTFGDDIETIDVYAFANTNISKVELSDNIISVAKSAFNETSLSLAVVPIQAVPSIALVARKVIITTGEELDKAQFGGCTNLEYIELADSITKINQYAFNNCTNLKTILLSKNLEYIHTEAFTNVKPTYLEAPLMALEYIDLEKINTLILLNGEEIPANSFNDLEYLETLVLLDTITYVGEAAFKNCPIKNLTITNESISLYNMSVLTQIENLVTPAFVDLHYLPTANLKTVVITEGTWKYFELTGAAKLESITLPDTITTITSLADCQSLKSIDIPLSVTYFGDNAFYNCSSLENIKIPHGATKFGRFFFEGCTSLKTITIPSSVTLFGKDVFKDCTSLETIYFEGTEEEWNNIPKSTSNLPDNVEIIYNYSYDN